MSALRTLGPALLGTLFFTLGLGAISAPLIEYFWDPDDPMLDGDPIDPMTGLAAEIVPGAPWIVDTEQGWRIYPDVVGDVDLVVRAGRPDPRDELPAPAAAGNGALPTGIAEPFGEGTPVVFTVIPSDGGEPGPYGTPVRPPYWDGLVVLLAAFPDLDGDGYVGVTDRDGDDHDDEIERAEWTPAGLTYAFGRDGAATGELVVGVGGPDGAPARVALVAAAFAGPIDPHYRDGVFPRGPAVMTALPFLPVTAPDELLHALPLPAVPPEPGSRIAVNVQVAFTPKRHASHLHEAFALALDGSEPTIDAAEIRSGRVVRVGLARQPDPESYRALPSRPLRPGLDRDGRPVPLEVLTSLVLSDDEHEGDDENELVLVALDRLGNVGDPDESIEVRVQTSGFARIVEPDRDDDPFSETVRVKNAHGTRIVLVGPGDDFDDANAGVLQIESEAGMSMVDLLFSDPDEDDSGHDNWRELMRVWKSVAAELGTTDFEPALEP